MKPIDSSSGVVCAFPTTNSPARSTMNVSVIVPPASIARTRGSRPALAAASVVTDAGLPLGFLALFELLAQVFRLVGAALVAARALVGLRLPRGFSLAQLALQLIDLELLRGGLVVRHEPSLCE